MHRLLNSLIPLCDQSSNLETRFHGSSKGFGSPNDLEPGLSLSFGVDPTYNSHQASSQMNSHNSNPKLSSRYDVDSIGRPNENDNGVPGCSSGIRGIELRAKWDPIHVVADLEKLHMQQTVVKTLCEEVSMSLKDRLKLRLQQDKTKSTVLIDLTNTDI